MRDVKSLVLFSEPDRKMDQKRIATKLVRSLNLQPEMRTRALVLVAADTAPGSSLRELLRLNDDAEDLKSLVVSFLQEEARGKSRSARSSARVHC
jgi:hypothetical protein